MSNIFYQKRHLGIEMYIKNHKEQNKEQTKDNGVQQHGGYTSLHIQKIDRPMLPGKLEEQSRTEESKKCCSDERGCPIVHSLKLLLDLLLTGERRNV